LYRGAEVFGHTMNEEPVIFRSEGLKLEGLLYQPRDVAEARGAVVCHPHPLYGGSMLDVIVEAILKAMWAIDCATLRFNFRGVGNSQGEYDEGRGEARDAEAAVKYIAGLRGMQRGKVILAGYSFGAMAAVNAAARTPEVTTVVAVAPPILADGVGQLVALKKRLVVVAGEEDRYCPPAQLEVLRNALIGLIRLKIIPGADHFFAGHEEQVTAALIDTVHSA
jgi:alpha/beta superfamily hydrolase